MDMTKRVSSGFDSFKRKNNMMVEEELRAFVGFYQKRENLQLDTLKKSFLQMDDSLV